MNKYYNDKFDETYYTEVLDNGLNVVIYHKPSFKSSSCVFATPYGALDVNQEVCGNIVHNNPGIAHFLEHKLFEDENGDAMAKFTALGCNVNAFTSYNETCYYFSGCLDNIDEPLNLLLDFVQQLNISLESVEKEKGIIIQELNMYKQNPDSRLIYEMFKALYVNHPLKYDIGGDDESVKNITYEELMECYKINYHPSNMTLIIVSPLDPNHLIDVVRNNQNKKTFADAISVKRYLEIEPSKVNEKDVCVNMDINNPKVCYAFKIEILNEDSISIAKYEWALRMAFEMHFSPLNKDYQKWLDEKIINDYFGYDIDFGDGYALIMFYSENKDSEQFKRFIDQELKNIIIDEDKLVQLKRRYYGKSFNTFNDIEEIAINYIRYKFAKLSYEEVIEMIMTIDVDFVKESLNKLVLDNYSLITIKK